MSTPANLHASVVVLRDRGIVITGSSGAGKSQLALALVGHADAMGCFGRLVADDQTFLASYGGRLIASAPPTLAGLVEVRGTGPVRIRHEARAPVDLLVRLVKADDAERFPEKQTEIVFGCTIPLLELAIGDRQAAAMAVLARLSIGSFR